MVFTYDEVSYEYMCLRVNDIKNNTNVVHGHSSWTMELGLLKLIFLDAHLPGCYCPWASL